MNTNRITTVINEPPTLLTVGTNLPPPNTRINVANVVNENNTGINMRNYNKEQRRLAEENNKRRLNRNMNTFRSFGIVNNNMDSNVTNNNSLTNNNVSINNGEFNNNALNNTEYTNSQEPLKQKNNVNANNTRKLKFNNVTNVRTYGINNFNKTIHKGPKESTSASWRSKLRRNPSLTISPSYRSRYNADLSYLAAKVAEKHTTQKEMLDAVKNNKHVKRYYTNTISDEIDTRSALTNKERALATKIKTNIIQDVRKKIGRIITTRNGHRLPVYNNLNLNRPNNSNNNMKPRKRKTRKQKNRKN
jgi:hypothetical protein